MSFVWKAERPLRTEEQVAREVHEVSLSRGLDEFASVLTLMAIRQESNFWCPWNRKDPSSHNYQFDSESNDGRSVAYLQQQNEVAGEVVAPEHDWWGPMSCRMDLKCSVHTFLERLDGNYRSALGDPYRSAVLIDNVQGSYWNGDAGHPGYYGKHYDYCWSLLNRALEGGVVDPPAPPAVKPRPSIERNPLWRGDPIWLPDVLRAFGVDVSTFTDSKGVPWDKRGHGDFDKIGWVLWHHTGNRNETDNGIAHHPSLGLAANMLVHPDGHTVLTGVGIAWHGGIGIYPGIREDDINEVSIGIECAHSGARGDPWPEAQMQAMINIGGAIKWFLMLGTHNQIAHKEWAGNENPLHINKQGKPDPVDIDMNWFREQIAKRADAGPAGEGDDMFTDEDRRKLDALFGEYNPERRAATRSVTGENQEGVETPLGYLWNMDGNIELDRVTRGYLFDVPDCVEQVERIAREGVSTDSWAYTLVDGNGRRWFAEFGQQYMRGLISFKEAIKAGVRATIDLSADKGDG